MKLFLKSALFVLFSCALVFLVLVVLSIQTTPHVNQHKEFSFDNVKRVKKLLDRSMPYKSRYTKTRRIVMSEQDLNLLAGYGISHVLKIDSIYSRVKLSENRAKILITFIIPSTPCGKYINICLDLEVEGTGFKPVSCKIGRLGFSGKLLKPLLAISHSQLLKKQVYSDLMENTESIKKLSISRNYLALTYKWNSNSFAKLQEMSKELFLSREHQVKLVFYNNRLAEELKPFKRKRVSLSRIIKPMFKHAQEQSRISHDPVLENKALLQVLAMYSTGSRLFNFVSKDLKKDLKPYTRTYLTLVNRRDLSQHFLVSAGLSVSAGSSFANFIGLVKEVEDSDGGTGFSFADLAADKAGVVLGEIASESEQRAESLQKKMVNIKRESDFMPAIDQLPEGIMELEFKRRYQDLDSKSYNMVNAEISDRIAKCKAFQ